MKRYRKSAVALFVVLAVASLSSICTASTDEKPRMAVMRFTNNTAAWWWKPGIGSELSDMLTNELASSKKFRMIERREIDSVLGEIHFNQSGYIDKKTKVKMHKIKGAQYLVMATVTSYEEDTEGKGGGLNFMGFSLGAKSAKSYIAVDLKVINTETTEIIDTRTIEGTSESTAHGVSGSLFGIGGNAEQKKKTPAGKAIRAAVINIAEYLQCSMVDKDECIDTFNRKEEKRKERTKSELSLDE